MLVDDYTHEKSLGHGDYEYTKLDEYGYANLRNSEIVEDL